MTLSSKRIGTSRVVSHTKRHRYTDTHTHAFIYTYIFTHICISAYFPWIQKSRLLWIWWIWFGMKETAVGYTRFKWYHAKQTLTEIFLSLETLHILFCSCTELYSHHWRFTKPPNMQRAYTNASPFANHCPESTYLPIITIISSH